MADFNFFLNRQGVRGNKGEQGEQGYSPRITVKTETAAEYVLNVQNEDGSFDTPNLRGNAIENLGGTYVRFDQDTEQMYTGYADTASTTSQGEVVLSTYEDLTSGGDESEVTTSKDVYDFVEAKISEASVNYVDIDDYTQKMNELDGEISDLDDNKLDFTDLSDTLVAGTNITITPNTQTGKITIAGEPVDQAQADWNQDDTSAPDYIKNKPTIPEAITVDDDFSTTSTNPVENRLITNAINLISNELEDFAEKDLSNLSSVGEARLHALKAYSDNGEILTDTKGLSNVIGYAHSTFDISKFTVTGSPVITNDGIASGFSSSNYIANANNITINADDDIYILSPVIEFSALNSTQQSIFSMYVTNNNNNALQFRINAQNQLLLFWKDNSGTDIIRYTTSSVATVNTKYQMLATRKTGVYNLYYRELGGKWINAGTSSSASFNGTYVIKYGVSLSTNALPLMVGSVDLKYCSITVDGVPVFSGNQTGIDTIKSDNYTAVGTPAISADGVFTNTTSDSNNYVKLSNFTATSNLKAEFRFDVVGGTFNQFILYDGLGAAGLFIGAYGISWNTYGLSNWRGQNFIKAGHSYKFYIQYNTDLSVEIGIKRDDENAYTTATSTYTTLPTEFSLGTKTSSSGSVKFDLNEIKFYSNDNLVYQPCLKIPYTQSKTGSKIVNAAYRDRVNDMAEQFGYANYYTLDEGNGNFTLPQVELSGLIEIAASTVPDGVVQSTSITNIVSLTQAEYDLIVPEPDTFYIITPSS